MGRIERSAHPRFPRTLTLKALWRWWRGNADQQNDASYSLQMNARGSIMQVMTDIVRLPDELGRQWLQSREALGMTKSELAEKAVKVREVVYRLEAGQDSTVSSMLAVLAALGLALRLEAVGL